MADAVPWFDPWVRMPLILQTNPTADTENADPCRAQPLTSVNFAADTAVRLYQTNVN